MKKFLISRRDFLRAAGVTSFISLVGCSPDQQADPAVDQSPIDLPTDEPTDSPTGDESTIDNRVQGKAFRLSTRGKRASRAAKAHAANKIFATAEAADAGRAHVGDTSSIVQIDLSETAWLFYFGATASVIDLRECAPFDTIATKLWGRKYATAPTDPAAINVTAQAVADRLSLAAGAPIDASWIDMPVIDSLGEYPATISLPCGTPVPFVLVIPPVDSTPPLCPSSETLATRDRLEALNLSIPKIAGDDGKLFSSVSTLDVQVALTAVGETIDRRYITLPEIRTLGVYDVSVFLSCNVIATLTITVTNK